jgi:hypothetical protein
VLAAFAFAQGAWADVESSAPRSVYELSEIAANGAFPSRGGPVDE